MILSSNAVLQENVKLVYFFLYFSTHISIAQVVELVDTPDLGSGAARYVGSSPILGKFFCTGRKPTVWLSLGREVKRRTSREPARWLTLATATSPERSPILGKFFCTGRKPIL